MPSGQFGGHPGFVLSQDLCADCSLGLNSAASLLPAPHSHPFTWGGKAVLRWSLGKVLPFGRVGAERAVCAKATWGWPRDPLGWREEEARIGPVQSREPGSVGRAPRTDFVSPWGNMAQGRAMNTGNELPQEGVSSLSWGVREVGKKRDENLEVCHCTLSSTGRGGIYRIISTYYLS